MSNTEGRNQHWGYVITALLALWVFITFAGYVRGELSFEFSVISLLTFLAVKA